MISQTEWYRNILINKEKLKNANILLLKCERYALIYILNEIVHVDIIETDNHERTACVSINLMMGSMLQNAHEQKAKEIRVSSASHRPIQYTVIDLATDNTEIFEFEMHTSCHFLLYFKIKHDNYNWW